MAKSKFLTTETPTSKDDLEELLIALKEAQKRGLDVEGIVSPFLEIQEDFVWNVDERGYFIKRDGSHFIPNSPRQEIFIHSNARFVGFFSGRGGGKALALNTPIMTSEGWKTIETVKIGDVVFDENGLPTNVVDKSDIFYDHKCYKVVFSDHSEIIADEGHQWFTWTHRARKAYGRAKNPTIHPEVRTTKQILDTLHTSYTKRVEHNHSIKVSKELEFPEEKEIFLDPYVLGIWLGDGSRKGSRIAIAEEFIVTELQNRWGFIRKNSSKYSYSLGASAYYEKGKNGTQSNPDGLMYWLKYYSLVDNKHIPGEYFLTSVENRMELLQGLMDSDGYVAEDGGCTFDSTSKQLAYDVFELCLGLGIKATMITKRAKLYGKDCGTCYRIIFTTDKIVFKLPRKVDRLPKKIRKTQHHRYIVDVVEMESVPVQCISVDSPNHLYLAGKTLIPTHNSAASAQKAMKKIQMGESGAVLNPSFENLKDSTWPELREWIDWNMVIEKHQGRESEAWRPNGPFDIVFKNGAKMMIKGVKDPDSARGPNINWLWYDEAGVDRDGMSWRIAIASVRIGNDAQSWVSTTPSGKQHWIYQFFILKQIPEEAIKIFEQELESTNRELISYSTNSIIDNKDNLDPLFYGSMIAAYPSGWLRQQELEGDFVDEGEALGDRTWFLNKEMKIMPDDELVAKKVRYWDLAATEKKITGKKTDDPDYTYGTRLSQLAGLDKRYVIEHMVGSQWSWTDIKRNIVLTAQMDGLGVPIYIEQEPGGGGKNIVAEIASIEELAGHTVRGHKPEGDKVIRASSWFSKAELGIVYYVRGNWNDDFLDQVGGFPLQKHDDMIDSISGAFQVLAPVRKWSTPKYLEVRINK